MMSFVSCAPRLARAALFAGLLLTVGLAAAPADDGLARVQQRVAQVPVLRGQFQQEKQVSGFRNPLRSQGSFLLAREQGVVWTTLKPFPSELVLTRDRIVSRQRDGGTRIEVDGRQQPALRSVNAMMFALMSGDVKALTGTFDVEVESPADRTWRMSLTPKSRALAQAFTSVQLRGDRYVREVEITEASGDRTHLVFSELSETPVRLTAEEAARFD
ncbi:outer membrane lipoprotein carrier protein LolA [Pseudoxanthomonas putridarboris]|uniref:Outer membrane lipoprotein carrier protein LolA n=1 Tax=Pseudoxanthomonas putridarboris TaxID=752605 RepID=A0ABU9J076_9GAMM